MARGDSKRQQLSEEVASYVRELIISGKVRPGEFLRMEPIAEAVGVSNTPVREGLLALSSEGFVELVPRRGFVVTPFTQQDVRDLFWVQAQLGGELAARAAKNITPEQLDELEAIVKKQDAAVKDGDEDAMVEYGHAFHRLINLAADSHRLALLLRSVVRHLPNRFYISIEGRVEATSEEHPLILEALRRRSAKMARSLMEQHILESADHLIETLEARGLWQEEREEAAPDLAGTAVTIS
ncbi:GntR family transcriptional regulator [Streptomyces cinereoruber]|nr:GntR family transcriptional regulator [Streptomyces cinereoruber]MBB4158221.1 DNA-binding GntR family transcriptional regulator [Streptomyces cinereoruber]MBY8819245.1 GntR family transcriptional regulator [Streptomyces cinereoruber]NIH63354.1 DNA-binding GntR family transcriptional regulator [Streptomyces cinereoruber]QEV36012.1 GntR family transcriptional regulator [Streptomyces cinereoruber]